MKLVNHWLPGRDKGNKEGRIMKYDVIVVGGGLGGLMAAKTAAQDGLKVILIERKKVIAQLAI